MKKSLVFVSILAIMLFLVSSCNDPRLSKIPSSPVPPSDSGVSGTGGGSTTPLETTTECVEDLSVEEGDIFTVGYDSLKIGSIFSNSVEITILNANSINGSTNPSFLISRDEAVMLDDAFLGVVDIAQNSNDPTLSAAILRTCA